MIKKKMKKSVLLVASSLVFTQFTPVALPFSQTTIAEAATVKLNTTSKLLLVSQTYTLKVKGTTKKVTWSSNKKTVATVSSKGKVTAKKAGKAVISAKVSGKTYKCTVTVSTDSYLVKAPFTGKRATFGTCSVVMPKSWVSSSTVSGGTTVYILTSSKTQTTPNITINQYALEGTSNEDYDTYKQMLMEQATEEELEEEYNAIYGDNAAQVSNIAFSDKSYNCGQVLLTTYDITILGNPIQQKI